MRTCLTALVLLTAAPSAAQTAVVLDFTRTGLPAANLAEVSGQAFDPSQNGARVYQNDGAESDEVPDVAGAPSKLAIEGSTRQTSASDACAASEMPHHVPGLDPDVARRRLGWWPVVSATECRYGIPAGLLDAVILQESRYLTAAHSPKGAIGLAQLMPGTAGDLGVANAWDPASNIDGGGRYLRAQLDRFQSVHLGVAAYNAGPGAVRASKGIPRNSETPEYVRRVLDYWSRSSDDVMQSVRRTALVLGFTSDSR
jgi:soluble lytic murein transglycosylase-like protein